MGRAPKKRFGQHWLTSPAIVQSIVDAAEIKNSDVVLEIGPGKGVLTGPLLDRAGHLYAVELDRGHIFTVSYAEDEHGTTGIVGTFWDLPG